MNVAPTQLFHCTTIIVFAGNRTCGVMADGAHLRMLIVNTALRAEWIPKEIGRFFASIAYRSASVSFGTYV
jgi:hypothetical protein